MKKSSIYLICFLLLVFAVTLFIELYNYEIEEFNLDKEINNCNNNLKNMNNEELLGCYELCSYISNYFQENSCRDRILPYIIIKKTNGDK